MGKGLNTIELCHKAHDVVIKRTSEIFFWLLLHMNMTRKTG
jgi:hypothetical protein